MHYAAIWKRAISEWALIKNLCEYPALSFENSQDPFFSIKAI
jgi:hypothetical protein